MEINPKVRNAAENGDLEQTITGGPSQPGDIQISDDVFGEVGEDGPNYRNVSLARVCVVVVSTKVLTFWTGWLDRSFGSDAEVTSRTWCAFYPECVRRPGNDSWHHLLAVHRYGRHVGWIHRWSFQAASPACLWFGRRWYDDCGARCP